MNVRALFKGWGADISPGYMTMGMTSSLLLQATREKKKQKKFPAAQFPAW